MASVVVCVEATPPQTPFPLPPCGLSKALFRDRVYHVVDPRGITPLLAAASEVPPMDSRERLLVAIHGGKPDRVPRALAFYHLDFESLAPPGQWRDACVDVAFVDFAPSPEERERMAAPQIEGCDWAIKIDETIRQIVLSGNHESIIPCQDLGRPPVWRARRMSTSCPGSMSWPCRTSKSRFASSLNG
jgi:hypothetical protein